MQCFVFKHVHPIDAFIYVRDYGGVRYNFREHHTIVDQVT